MTILKYFLSKLKKSELAQGLVEYAIILALISAVTVGALSGVGNEVNKTLDKVNNPEVTVKIDEGYIPIATAEDINNIRNDKTQTFGKGSSWEGTYTSGLNQKYIQVADINLSKLDWEPIDSFTGTYEGSDLTIKNLKVNYEGSSGLFGTVQGAKLQDINLKDVSVIGTNSTGGLVGKATQATVLDSISITGLVKHKGVNKSLGGIVGELSDKSKLVKSYSDVKIDGNDNVGGLVGHIKESIIYQSYSHGTLDGKVSIGGLVGVAESNSQISQTYANVKLKGTDSFVGGLVGKDDGANVKQSHWDVETSGLKETANDKGEGNTSYEMTLARTYKDWDFEGVWKIKDGETYPSFEGENTRLNEITVTFVDNDGKEYPVLGLVGSTLEDYHEGEIPKPTKDGSKFVGWNDTEGKDFGMNTKLGDKDLKVSPKWELNEIVTKSFYPSEQMKQKQEQQVKIDDLHELVSYDVDKGKIDLINRTGGLLDFTLSNRPYDRRVQTGGEEILADSKTVSAQGSSNYNSDGYTGNLSSYVYSGSLIPAESKNVSAQTSSWYNDGIYSGTLNQYHYSGSAGDTQYISGQTSSYYNDGTYSGSLSSYLESGSYTASDTQYVSGLTSSSYNSGGYTGNLERYLYSGTTTPSESRVESRTTSQSNYEETVTYQGAGKGWMWSGSNRNSPGNYSYNSGGFSGILYYDVSRDYRTNDVRPALPSKPTLYQRAVALRSTMHYVCQGTVTKPGTDTRVYRYRGNVTRPASDTRVYKYSGYVSKPDTRTYRYQGSVTKPAVDTREYRYRGEVNRPYSDSRTWDNYYKYGITVNYRPK